MYDKPLREFLKIGGFLFASKSIVHEVESIAWLLA